MSVSSDGFQGDFMYQRPPPPPSTQNYNDFMMQQELHQRLNYGPTGGKKRNILKES